MGEGVGEGEGEPVCVGGGVDDTAASIAALCQRDQVDLYELAPIRRDLERVFREANEGGDRAL